MPLRGTWDQPRNWMQKVIESIHCIQDSISRILRYLCRAGHLTLWTSHSVLRSEKHLGHNIARQGSAACNVYKEPVKSQVVLGVIKNPDQKLLQSGNP